MTFTFLETFGFTSAIADYFGTDEEYRKFQEALLANPERGVVIPGCGSLRKVRWAEKRRGKGKRGGLRIIYLYVAEADAIFLLDVYDKGEADDLTAAEKRFLVGLEAGLRAEAQTLRGGKRKGNGNGRR